jgi:Zn-dependent peptidase ImmA (M78 family)/transcriptional regulator with XRE-family HTH domain
MKENHALITPAVLTWARERLALSEQAVADKLGTKLEIYKSWESGGASPTMKQAKEFAKLTKISFAWLYLSEPPRKFDLPKNTDYRTFGNTPVKGDLATIMSLIADVTMRRDAMIEIFKERGVELPVFMARVDSDANTISSIAKTIRRLLGITAETQAKIGAPDRAFKYYREALGNIGILAFQAAKIDKNLMRGLSIYYDVFPIVVVNRKDEFSARIFSLFHELAHTLTGVSGICNNMDIVGNGQFEIEIRCNKIAAEALVPKADLLEDANLKKVLDEWNDRIVRKIANRFTTSREVIVGRLFELGKIDFGFYKAKMQKYSDEYALKSEKSASNKQKGGIPKFKDVYSQVGSFYAGTIIGAYHDEIITLEDASHFLSGLKIPQFEQFEKEFIA